MKNIHSSSKQLLSGSRSRASLKSISSPSEAFHPLICKKSLRLAKNLTSSRKRLLVTPEQKTPDPIKYDFNPKINSKSSRILKNSQRGNQKAWEILYEHSIIQKIKLENARKAANLDEMSDKEYTFRPKVNMDKKKSVGVITRNNSWLRNRSEKIIMKAQEEQIKELEECTFIPYVNQHKVLEVEPLEGINGVSAFLIRQFAAKSKNEVKEHTTSTGHYKDLTLLEYKEAVKGLNEYLHAIKIE